MSTLAQVWGNVKDLLADGISIIPVRDKDEKTKTGETYLAKTPYAKWKEFQNRQISEPELWALMEEKDTTAIAVICGEISGNIEVIDVDVKYRPGIDAILMNDIRTFYPDLFSRLRIHKTPSGGYHIIYRVNGHSVEGNLKLAGRIASEAEIELQKSKGSKRPNKEINFLETRGEGGYILSPPSLGYTVHKDNPIPVITWEERCSLITLCRTYNEIVKEAPKVKASKNQESIYDENPFEHFNNDVDPSDLMQQFGWKYSHDNAHFIWYTRPDKDKGVSASWNKEKRIFFIFTSSTELQENRGYNAATILAELQFGGDKSKTYYHLIQRGFGKVKRKVEEGMVKKAALSGDGIPANFSPDAKQTFETLKISIQQDHPHGTFWEQDENDKVQISREGVYQVAKGLGFNTYKGDIVQTIDKRVHKCTPRYFFDSLKNYIVEEDARMCEDIYNAYEAFIQRAGTFTIERIPEINEDLILCDDKHTAYKCYNNGYLKITADGITKFPYSQMDKLIWDHAIQKRDYNYSAGGKYIEYLKLAVVDFNQAVKILGYLAHEYKDETTGFIIVLTEQCPDPKQGGGSGKNVYCNLMKLTTSYTSKPGSQAKFDEKFFQSWNGQKIFGISDVPPNFDFAFLKEPSTGNFIHKKLFKDEVEVDNKYGPKFIVQTNYSYECSDGGLKRRIIPLEFTGFFTAAGGLDVHFNAHFPNEWTVEDYAGFDSLVATGIKLWLKDNRKLHATSLTDTGWLKQWEQSYKHATGFILHNWKEWTSNGYVTNETFKKGMETYFNDNNVSRNFWPSLQKINSALETYAERHNIAFAKDKSVRFTNGIFKCRLFGNVHLDKVEQTTDGTIF